MEKWFNRNVIDEYSVLKRRIQIEKPLFKIGKRRKPYEKKHEKW